MNMPVKEALLIADEMRRYGCISRTAQALVVLADAVMPKPKEAPALKLPDLYDTVALVVLDSGLEGHIIYKNGRKVFRVNDGFTMMGFKAEYDFETECTVAAYYNFDGKKVNINRGK